MPNLINTKWYVPQSFGAKGNGTTDDTSAIMQAINIAISQGGMIYFPPGIYSVTPLSNPFSSNVPWKGDGAGKTIIQFRASSNDRMIVQSADVDNLTIQGITFDYNGANQTDGANAGARQAVLFQGGIYSNILFHNCEFINGRSGQMLALTNANTANYNIEVSGCRFSGNNNSGTFPCDDLYIGGTKGVRVIGNYHYGCTDTCIAGDGNNDVVIKGNTCRNFTGQGIGQACLASPAALPANIIVTGNTVNGNAANYGISLVNVTAIPSAYLSHVVIGRNVVINCHAGIWVGDVINGLVSDNIVHDWLDVGIAIDSHYYGTDAITLNGNKLYTSTLTYGILFTKTAPYTITKIDAFNNSIIGAGVAAGGDVPTGADWTHDNNRGIDY